MIAAHCRSAAAAVALLACVACLLVVIEGSDLIERDYFELIQDDVVIVS